MAQAAFLGLLNKSVAVRSATTSLTELKYPVLDDFAATADSPIDAAIQPRSAFARDDPFMGRWPEATHVMYCATGIDLDYGYLVSWTDVASVTRSAYVLGQPEDAGGRGHHLEVALGETQLAPSGVT